MTKIAFWLILLLLAKWRENLNLAKIAFALILFTATKWRENLNLARYARLWKKVTFFILNFALGGDGTIFSRKTNPSFTDAKKKKKCTCSSREGKKNLRFLHIAKKGRLQNFALDTKVHFSLKVEIKVIFPSNTVFET